MPIARGVAAEVLSSKSRFHEGDVLYGKLRPYLDKAVLADCEGVCTTELLVLRPRAGIPGRYLACVVHSPDFVRHAMAGTTGAHHPRTSWHHIRQFEVIDFEPVERDAIAALLWKVHDALRLSELATESAEKLKQAAMRELFTRGLRAEAQKETEIGPRPRGWRLCGLSDVALIERGRFLHRPRNEPRFYGGKTPFVQTGDVVRAGGLIREFTQTLNGDGVSISRVFKAGTILITIAANIGYTGILTFDAACPDSLVAIQPHSDVIPRFLQLFLETQQPEMDRLAPKGTQKNINIQFLSPWPVVVPQIDEQREIVDIVEALSQRIDLHKKKRAVLEDLFKSLLHKLMTGEIRVTDLDLTALEQATGAQATP